MSVDDWWWLKDFLMSKELVEIDLSIVVKKSGLLRCGLEFEVLV